MSGHIPVFGRREVSFTATICLAAGLAALAAGCGCLSAREAAVKRADLRARNWNRAARTMRATAEAHGAALLPTEAQELALPLECIGEAAASMPPVGDEHDTCSMVARQSRTCARWAADRRTFVLRRADGHSQLVVPISDKGGQYTRLARRGDTLIILRAQVSTHIVGSATQCECDGMPRVVCPRVMAFILDEVFTARIEELSVPMTEDILDWSCKVVAV